MSKQRLVQHRANRDTSTRETAQLKRENETLKRQVARLRKQLSQEDIEETPDPEEATPKPKCPECSSTDLVAVQTPSGKTVTSCKSCRKWRSKAT